LWHLNQWQGEKKPVDFYVVKGILDGLFDVLGLKEQITYKQAKRDGLHPGRTAEILLNGINAGFIGQVHPKLQKQMDLTETYVFELALQQLLEANLEELKFSVIPRFPSMTRDIALVVDREIVAGDLKETISEAGGKLLKEVSVFDLYEGDKLEENKKSLAFSLRYFDPERTLTDEEVTKAHEKVLRAVEEKYAAVLRG
jgi:phenylalanyl-tRNA synthetase beta chain